MPLNADCGTLILYDGLDLSYERLTLNSPMGYAACRGSVVSASDITF